MRTRTALLAAAMVSLPAVAAAGDWSGTATASSDYRFRGVTQTDGGPAIAGSVDWSSGAAYAGVWASNVDFGDDETKVEVDVYGGMKSSHGAWTVDVGAVAYLYPGAPGGANYDYVEAKLAVSRKAGPLVLTGGAYWSPEFFGETGEALYLEAAFAADVGAGVSLSGAVGRQDVSYDGDYATWNLGVTVPLGEAASFDVRWHDTDAHGFGEWFEGALVASVKATF